MYHTYSPEPLWPVSFAPLPPVSDTALRVIAELSGMWEGGTAPGLYAEPSWQLSREITIPDTAWLYIPYLVGDVSVYVGERLWSRGETSVWVPLLGPGKIKLTLRGDGSGGLPGGAYLLARKGPVAWPLDVHSPSPSRVVLQAPPPPSPEKVQAASPPWLGAIGMLLWALLAWWSAPIQQANIRGPWTPTSPSPLENGLGLILTGFLLLLLTDWVLLGLILAISLPLEVLFCAWLKCPPEKIWQSWLPVLLLAWIFAHPLPPVWVAWGGWALRSLLLTLYMPRLAYLCLGSLYLYLLTLT